jgi:excinuclease UvrABC ATPase subunit
LIFNNNLTINEGGILPYTTTLSHDSWFTRTFKIFAKENDIPLTKRLLEISDAKKELILKGTGEKEYYVEGENRWGRETAIQRAL